MTLTLAWVHSEVGAQELWVASDSRLRPFAWDAAPKIVPLPRGDSVVAFAGDTMYAYPMMLQMFNAVSSSERLLSRAEPIEMVKDHLVEVVNRMLDELREPPTPLVESPEALFLLAGYSSRSQRFLIWTLHYDPEIGRFTFRPATPWGGGNEKKLLAVVGDEIPEAKERLISALRAAGKISSGGFAMEPLSVLVDMIDAPEHHTIGGQPQLVKVHSHLQAVPWVIERGGVRSLLGRPLLDSDTATDLPHLTLPAPQQR